MGMQQAGGSKKNSSTTHTEHAYGLNPNQMSKLEALKRARQKGANTRTRRMQTMRQACTGSGGLLPPGLGILKGRSACLLTGTGTIMYQEGKARQGLELTNITMEQSSYAPD